MLTRPHIRVKAPTLPAIATFVVLCCLALPGMAGDTYYRWTNKDGSTEYTKQQPPEGIPYTEVTPLGVGKGSAPVKQAAKAEEQTAGGEGEATEQPKKDPKLCKQARDNLNTLQAHERIRIVDEKGEPTVLNEEQRQEQIQRAKKIIDKNC